MRASTRLLLPVLGVAAVFAAPSASAAPVCTGTAEDGYVCVDSDAAPGVNSGPGTWVGRCVLLPGETACRQIGTTVPGVSPSLGRPTGLVYCSGNCGTTVVNFVVRESAPVTNAVGLVVDFATELAGEVQDRHRWCAGGGTTFIRELPRYAECMTT